MKKVCSKCKENKSTSEFYVMKTGKIRSECKKCNIAATKAYKDRNKDKIAFYNKQYKQKNKEEIRTYNREYNIINRKDIQKRHTAYLKVKRATDPKYKYASTQRSRILKFIKGKSKSTKELLGCDLHFYVTWLEYQFDDEMKFENHGNMWHIDHVIPCSSFDLTKENEQIKCFHWSNTRPLIKQINLIKGDSIDEEDIMKHQKIINKFIKQISLHTDKYFYTILN